jgi:hypothetical protein
MRVDQYLKQVPAAGPASVYGDLPALLSSAVRNGRYPPPLPLPPPRNAATGAFPDSVNAFRLELAALSRGHDRALFITAADAAFLSLKPCGKPLAAVFRSKNRFTLQNLYFLDSFTPDSLEKLYSSANPRINSLHEKNEKRPLPPRAPAVRNKTAERVLFYISACDTGCGAGELRSESAALYRRNSSPASPGYSSAAGAYKTCMANIPPKAVKAFDFLRKYRAQQLTGLSILGPDDAGGAKQSFERLSASDPQEIIPAVFFAMSFAAQLCGRKLSLPAEGPAFPLQGRRASAGKETPVDELLRS